LTVPFDAAMTVLREKEAPSIADLAFDNEVSCKEKIADPFAEVPLELDPILADGSACAAGLFQLLREILEKSGILREAEDHRHGLAAAPGLLDPQLRDGPAGHGRRGFFAAAAAPLRLAAAGADAPSCGRIHDARAAIGHAQLSTFYACANRFSSALMP